jgi:hypothetical protein
MKSEQSPAPRQHKVGDTADMRARGGSGTGLRAGLSANGEGGRWGVSTQASPGPVGLEGGGRAVAGLAHGHWAYGRGAHLVRLGPERELGRGMGKEAE